MTPEQIDKATQVVKFRDLMLGEDGTPTNSIERCVGEISRIGHTTILRVYVRGWLTDCHTLYNPSASRLRTMRDVLLPLGFATAPVWDSMIAWTASREVRHEH